MSHLRFCRAILSRVKVARQNRRCDMALSISLVPTSAWWIFYTHLEYGWNKHWCWGLYSYGNRLPLQ